VPVPEVDYDKWKDCPKPYCDTTSHSEQVSITCVCDYEIRIDKSPLQGIVICKHCGRVYRSKETRSYTVEEYLGPER
jgi:hypothetical protein